MISKNIIRDIYYSDKKLTSRDYEQSRKMLLFEGATGVSIYSLTTGAFLAGVGKYLGASDSVNGIIGALPVLTCVVQMFSSMVFEKLQYRKLLIASLSLSFRFLLGLMFFIPALAFGKNANLGILIFTYGIAYSISAFLTPAASNLLVSLTPDSIRGKYLANKDAVSLAFSTVVTIALGKVLDVFRNNGSEGKGFFVVGLSVIVLGIINFIALTNVKEPKSAKSSEEIDLKKTLTVPLMNKGFRKVIYLSIFWNIALQIGGPFFSIYMVTGLKLDYAYIMILGLISSLVRVFSARYWGKIADNKSWTYATKASLLSLAVCHFLWMFAAGNLVSFLMPIVNIIGGLAWAGLSISMFNLQFIFAPTEERTMYLGMNACIGGVVGFLTTLFASYLVRVFEGKFIMFLGISIGNMQVLFGMSAVLIVLCSLYVHKFMEYKES